MLKESKNGGFCRYSNYEYEPNSERSNNTIHESNIYYSFFFLYSVKGPAAVVSALTHTAFHGTQSLLVQGPTSSTGPIETVNVVQTEGTTKAVGMKSTKAYARFVPISDWKARRSYQICVFTHTDSYSSELSAHMLA